MSKQLLPITPHSSLGVRGICGTEGCITDGQLEGQNESLQAREGLHGGHSGRGRDPISAQSFKQRTAQVRKWK